MHIIHELIDPREAYGHIEDVEVREACIAGRTHTALLTHRGRVRLYEKSAAYLRQTTNNGTAHTAASCERADWLKYMRANNHLPDKFTLYLRGFWLV